MEESTKSLLETFFGIFSYPRSSKLQKEKAVSDIQNILESYGYSVKKHDENKTNRNRLIGNTNENIETLCENPQYIITAHYDTRRYAISRTYKTILKNSSTLQVLKVFIAMFIVVSFILYSIIALIVGKVPLEKSIIFALLLSAWIIAAIVYYILTHVNIKSIYAADDNTSGLVAVLTLASMLRDHKNIKFILFDNEEKGLWGSKEYVKQNLNGIQNSTVINLDSIGRGKHIFIRYHKKKILEIEFILKLLLGNIPYTGYTLLPKSNSDCISFSKKGIKAFTISRSDIKLYGKKVHPYNPWIHTKDDILENIDIGRIKEVIEIVYKIVK